MIILRSSWSVKWVNPVRENRVITAQRLEEPRKGVYVYDMGQNMPGVPRITFRNLQPGQRW